VALRANDSEVAKAVLWSPNSVGKLLNISIAVLEGDIASRKGGYDQAILSLDQQLEDGPAYIEPPDWGLPTRYMLGAVLLEAGRSEEAETVYWV
jgi:Flp pilus assembly protein TadD